MKTDPWPACGIHYGLSNAEYRADDIRPDNLQGKALSVTTLKAFADNPYTWRHGEPFAGNASTEWGNLVDCLALTPERFGSDYMVGDFPDWRTKAAKDFKDNAIGIDMTPILRGELEEARKAAFVVIDRLGGGQTQTQVAWRCRSPYGFDLKGMVDIVPSDDGETLIDLKTVNAQAMANVRTLEAHVAKFRYHWQAAFYLGGWNAASGQDRSRFKFIFSCSEPPYEVAVLELRPSAIEVGQNQVAEALERFAECHANDTWPSYWSDKKEIGIPRYAEGDAQ